MNKIRENRRAIKNNGQSRDTGSIGHTRHTTKINKTLNTTQKTKNIRSNTDPIEKQGVNPCAHEG
jgi:hypothetical protein